MRSEVVVEGCTQLFQRHHGIAEVLPFYASGNRSPPLVDLNIDFKDGTFSDCASAESLHNACYR